MSKTATARRQAPKPPTAPILDQAMAEFAALGRALKAHPATTSWKRAKGQRVEPIRFESINDPDTATNDEHIKTLVDELPYMRMAALFLNMNDRELEAKIYTSRDAHLWIDVVEQLISIRNRWKAGADMCQDGASRIVAVLDRVVAEEGQDKMTAGTEARKAKEAAEAAAGEVV